MTEHNKKNGHHEKSEAKKKEIIITLPMPPKIRGIRLSTVTAFAAVLLLAIVLFQSYQAYTLSKAVDAMAAKAQEQAKLPIIEVTSIEADCAECVTLTDVKSAIEAAKVNVTKRLILKPGDADSQQLITQLITKYGIQRLPTLIVTSESGEIDKVSFTGFTKANNGEALVYTQTPAPYVDAASGEVKGLVSLTYVNASSCKQCTDLMPVVEQLRGNVKVASLKVVDKDTIEGKKLLEEYALERLPGILVSNGIYEYPLGAQLAGLGSVKKNRTIALAANPPYLNVSAGRVAGIAQLIMLNDSSCNECYDVTMHLPIVKSRFQVYLEYAKIVDVSSEEGKSLVSKHNITAVPTILIAGDASAYPPLVDIWRTVGTAEADGTFVFRTMSAIAGSPYKDLRTGKVEQNAPQQQ